MRSIVLAALGLTAATSSLAAALELREKIPLPGAKGRIDHVAYDAQRQRLFVAELGNNSVAVVDLRAHRLEHRIAGLDEPQGIAWFDPLHRLYVANGGDGTLHAYDGNDFRQLKTTRLGSDADNIRIDPSAGRLYVGYGEGALAVLDPGSLERVANIPLKAHPEGFQLSAGDGRIYVNLPGTHEIAVVDTTPGGPFASWPANRWSANYPMAIDEELHSIVSVFRQPAKIVRFSMRDGTSSGEGDVCSDADDVFVDARRRRVYVICGQGMVDVLDRATFRRLDRFPTSAGARTGLYVASADRLFVAAPAAGGTEAAVWELKPFE